ncbi:MAG: PIN domain-containing protein [Dehalococcoidia bacterium]|nr:PIN domain-containing protein [Dehalococcoidia bacterium]
MPPIPEPLRAIDANVLLRYFLKDVPAQGEKAHKLIDSEEPLGLTAVALAETAWTLTGSLYRRERDRVAMDLVALLARENIVAIGFDKIEAQMALAACTSERGSANFGDALIAACARSAGLREIYSFDQRFARAGLTPVPPP